ncbi:hypothetical protein OAG63_01945, partial [Methylacidiphilales bacterium]|nr:hypothetical protein [Candidatus Methylacidiphilales bacterium]
MNAPELPDLFRFENGKRVRTRADWTRRRKELLDLIVKTEYGGLPPASVKVRAEELHRSGTPRLLDAELIQYRLTVEGASSSLSFRLDVLVPKGAISNPSSVVLSGDGCWHFVSDEVAIEVLKRGHVLAQFSRAEIASDNYGSERKTGIYPVFPKGKYGALSAWAWGYHRCIDFLQTQAYVDPKRIAIIG